MDHPRATLWLPLAPEKAAVSCAPVGRRSYLFALLPERVCAVESRWIGVSYAWCLAVHAYRTPVAELVLNRRLCSAAPLTNLVCRHLLHFKFLPLIRAYRLRFVPSRLCYSAGGLWHATAINYGSFDMWDIIDGVGLHHRSIINDAVLGNRHGSLVLDNDRLTVIEVKHSTRTARHWDIWIHIGRLWKHPDVFCKGQLLHVVNSLSLDLTDLRLEFSIIFYQLSVCLLCALNFTPVHLRDTFEVFNFVQDRLLHFFELTY